MSKNTTSLWLLTPGLALIITAESAVLTSRALGVGTGGLAWTVAGLIAGFSLSGSV